MSIDDAWMEKAACRGYPTALFFPAEHPDDETDGDEDIAKQICGTCPVQEPCKVRQIDEAYGVRGHLSAEERGYGARGRLGKNTIRGLADSVAEVLAAFPDTEFTADTMNTRILEMSGRRWPRNSINSSLLRAYRSGLAARRSAAHGLLLYRLNKDHA